MENNKKIFTRREAAKLLDVSLGTLQNWERAGHIKPSRIGRRVYFTETQIDKALNGQG